MRTPIVTEEWVVAFFKKRCVVTREQLDWFLREKPHNHILQKRSYFRNPYICLEFPYLINYLKKEDGKLLCYDAHNVEYELMQKKYSNKRIIFKNFVLTKIYKAEKKACEICDIVLTTSQRDKDLMKKIYNIKDEKIHVIPNGTWTRDINATNFNEKIIAKKQFNVRNAILFIGGSYGPNFEAVKHIYKWAEQASKYDFLIIGSSGSILKNVKPLDNLKILGSVDEEEKKMALIAADIAIVPILRGGRHKTENS